MPHPTFPKNEEELTPELLTAVLSEDRPGLKVEGLTIVEAIRLRTPVLSREPPCPSLACTGHGEGCRMGL